jgi:hypothetical protein
MLHLRTLCATTLRGRARGGSVALRGRLMTRGSAIRKRLEHRLKSAVPARRFAPRKSCRFAGRFAARCGSWAWPQPNAGMRKDRGGWRKAVSSRASAMG